LSLFLYCAARSPTEFSYLYASRFARKTRRLSSCQAVKGCIKGKQFGYLKKRFIIILFHIYQFFFLCLRWSSFVKRSRIHTVVLVHCQLNSRRDSQNYWNSSVLVPNYTSEFHQYDQLREKTFSLCSNFYIFKNKCLKPNF